MNSHSEYLYCYWGIVSARLQLLHSWRTGDTSASHYARGMSRGINSDFSQFNYYTREVTQCTVGERHDRETLSTLQAVIRLI